MRTKLYGSLTGLALAVASLTSPSAIAETNEPEWRYAGSLISAPQMPKDFKYFPYVNPDAPKGGRFAFHGQGHLIVSTQSRLKASQLLDWVLFTIL